jgi:group I intron endonuclease
MIIYKATNLINGKVYIGQTINSLNRRISNHYKDSKKSNYSFMNALRKYKREDWNWDIIDNAYDLDQLNLKEEFWIIFFDSINKNIGYNLKMGGSNKTFNEEVKRRISEAHKGKKKSKEHIESMRKVRIGKYLWSKEKRKALSKRHKENKVGVGIPKSEEHKKNLSKSKLGSTHKGTEVLDLNTNIIYKKIKEAQDLIGIRRQTIRAHCKNKVKNPRFQYVK